MDEMNKFMEQLEAAKDVAHHYICFNCQKFAGHTPVVVIAEENNQARAVILVACISCAKELGIAQGE